MSDNERIEITSKGSTTKKVVLTELEMLTIVEDAYLNGWNDRQGSDFYEGEDAYTESETGKAMLNGLENGWDR